ncbi:MAG: DUF1838 family protein [Rhodospirillaceae bacterium]|nr:DUF1838 family protein [Rhodospirillaceae bacterium]
MTISLTRRATLAGAAVAPVLGTAAAATADLPDKVRLYARARGAPLDRQGRGAMGMTWYSGRYWGKRAYQAAKLFFRVDGFSFNKMVMNPDGSCQQDMVEVGFWLDPATGAPLDDWINPFNGLPCKPQHYKSSQSLRFGADGNVVPAGEAVPGRKFAGYITEPVMNGDSVWIGEDLIVEAIRPAPAADADLSTVLPPIQTATSLVTYTMRLQDIKKPEREFLPATMNYQTMGNWYPWMRMGYETGQCMFQLQGKKLRSLDEVPASLRALIDARRPGFLENPGI